MACELSALPRRLIALIASVRTVVTEAEVVAAPPTRGADKVALHVHKRDVGFRRAPIDRQHRLIRKHP